MPKLPKSDGAAPKKPRSSGKRRRARDGAVAVAEKQQGDLDRRRVDDAKAKAKAKGNGKAAAREPAEASELELNDFERDLLRDLLAVIEEHERVAVEPIDREAIEKSFFFACE